jgi:hypothetical protein
VTRKAPPDITALDSFRTRWATRRDDFGRFGASVDAAKLCDAILADFDSARRSVETEALRIGEAARRCGLSVDHIGRLVRNGEVPNAGRKHAPRVRICDLPRRRRIRAIVASADIGYDPVADARSLLESRLHSGDEHGKT